MKVRVHRPGDAVVHRAASLRVRVQDHGNGRARAGAGLEKAFEATIGAGEDDWLASSCPGLPIAGAGLRLPESRGCEKRMMAI